MPTNNNLDVLCVCSDPLNSMTLHCPSTTQLRVGPNGCRKVPTTFGLVFRGLLWNIFYQNLEHLNVSCGLLEITRSRKLNCNNERCVRIVKAVPSIILLNEGLKVARDPCVFALLCTEGPDASTQKERPGTIQRCIINKNINLKSRLNTFDASGACTKSAPILLCLHLHPGTHTGPLQGIL
jgi:hypothetical protein